MNLIKRSVSRWNRLPKSAVPCDSESFIGFPDCVGDISFKFVYKTKNKKYIIQRVSGIRMPVCRYCKNI